MNKVFFDKKIVLTFMSFLFVVMLLLLREQFFSTPFYDVESKMLYIQRQKDIAYRDFSFIMQQLQPQTEIQHEQSLLTLSLQEEQFLETSISLKLHAIMNDHALVNETWLSLHESLQYNKAIYILQKITSNAVLLQNRENLNDTIYLEVFTAPKGLLLDVR